MAYKSEKNCSTLSKHSRVCAEHFAEDSFEKNIAVRSFIGTLFQASSTCIQERRGIDDFNFSTESCRPAIAQKNNEKQAKNAFRTAGELLCHFPNKISFVFRSKTIPKNDALTQKCSNVQDNSDFTKQPQPHSSH